MKSNTQENKDPNNDEFYYQSADKRVKDTTN